MDAIPAINEEVDDPASHAGHPCLSTPVILREIFLHLPNRDLIKLSRVNKQWNFEARSVLKIRGSLLAYICSGKKSGCEDLENFASDLSQMRVVTFAGIYLTVYHQGGSCQSASKGSLHPSIDVILQRVPLKYVKVHLLSNWDECKDCPEVAFAKKVLKDFGGVIEELSLDTDTEEVELLRHIAPPKSSFPRLKILKIEAEVGDDAEDFTDFVKTMVASAPNLEELHLGDLNLDENVLEGSSAMLVPSRTHFNPLHDQVGESLVSVLRPRRIELQQELDHYNFDPELLHTLIPTLLQASRTALQALQMDLLFAVPLMCYGIRLENVTTLEICVNDDLCEPLKPVLLKLVKLFDFTHIFPKLKKVEIVKEPEHFRSVSIDQIGEFVAEWNGMGLRSLIDCAINIKHLVLRGSAFDSFVSFWAEIFPHVTTLSVILKYDTSPAPFTLVWEHLKNLKELEVEHRGDPSTVENLDSLFCGILPEEIAELRGMDDEYLGAVNIVPVMPSITCMRDLNKFTFRYVPHTPNITGRDPNFIFSKVTGWMGFARCPNLVVAIETASNESGEEGGSWLDVKMAGFRCGVLVSSSGSKIYSTVLGTKDGCR